MKKNFIMIGLALALIAIVVMTSGFNQDKPRPGEKIKEVMDDLTKKVGDLTKKVDDLTKRIDELELDSEDLYSKVSDIEEALLLAEDDEEEENSKDKEKEGKDKGKEEKEKEK